MGAVIYGLLGAFVVAMAAVVTKELTHSVSEWLERRRAAKRRRHDAR
jgi:ABC-type proline/glycine betaine transport system permease subunit